MAKQPILSDEKLDGAGFGALIGSTNSVMEPVEIESKPLIRVGFQMEEDVVEKFKALCYWKRTLYKDEFREAMLMAIEKYENDHGELKPKPK
jgi:hypothetical protein